MSRKLKGPPLMQVGISVVYNRRTKKYEVRSDWTDRSYETIKAFPNYGDANRFGERHARIVALGFMRYTPPARRA